MRRAKWIFLISFILTALTARVAFAEATLFNGYDWRNIDSLPCHESAKRHIKVTFIKLIYETALFQDVQLAPEVKTNERFLDIYARRLHFYLRAIDNFYSPEENRKIPLLYAVLLASKEESGAPKAQIEAYKTSILKNLAKYNLL